MLYSIEDNILFPFIRSSRLLFHSNKLFETAYSTPLLPWLSTQYSLSSPDITLYCNFILRLFRTDTSICRKHILSSHSHFNKKWLRKYLCNLFLAKAYQCLSGFHLISCGICVWWPFHSIVWLTGMVSMLKFFFINLSFAYFFFHFESSARCER